MTCLKNFQPEVLKIREDSKQLDLKLISNLVLSSENLSELRRLVRASLRFWSDATSLRFVEIRNDRQAEIEISFQRDIDDWEAHNGGKAHNCTVIFIRQFSR